MKKIILAALASTVIASSASANFYAGVHGGGNISKFMFDKKDDHVTGVKLHRQLDIKGGIEVGYNVMDNLAVGVAVDGYLNPSLKTDKSELSTKADWYSAVMNNAAAVATPATATTVVAYPVAGANFAGVPTKAEHNFTIFSGMVKARLDLIDLDMAQIYVTGGIGGAYISEDYKVSTEKVDAVAASGVTPAVVGYTAVPALAEVSIKTKAAYGLAFAGGAGVAFKLSDAMFLNVGIEYANMGETSKEFEHKDKGTAASKALSKDNSSEAFKGETKFDAVNVVAGIRFNF